MCRAGDRLVCAIHHPCPSSSSLFIIARCRHQQHTHTQHTYKTPPSLFHHTPIFFSSHTPSLISFTHTLSLSHTHLIHHTVRANTMVVIPSPKSGLSATDLYQVIILLSFVCLFHYSFVCLCLMCSCVGETTHGRRPLADERAERHRSVSGNYIIFTVLNIFIYLQITTCCLFMREGKERERTRKRERRVNSSGPELSAGESDE